MLDYIHMGSLGRPHGIKGEIVLDWYGVSPFSMDQAYYLTGQGQAPFLASIENVRHHKGKLLIKLRGIEDRTHAEQMRGKQLLLPKNALEELSEDEAYISDLLGCSVYLEDGSLVGRFTHTIEGTGTSVWAIQTPDKKEILFPAEPDFIVTLAPKEGRIVIAPPHGLLDLYLSAEKQEPKDHA